MNWNNWKSWTAIITIAGAIGLTATVKVDCQGPPDPAPTPGPVDPPTPVPFTGFQYIESIKLPEEAAGASMGFAAGCVTLRKIDGQTYFVFDTHISTHGMLWVGKIDGTTVVPVQTLGRPYGELVPSEAGWYVTSLRFEGDTLFWTFGKDYNSNQKAESFAGKTTFKPGTWEVVSSELLPAVPQGNLWARGGTLQAADGTLLLGLGGYYSIFGGGSYGPSLVDPITGKAWLGYPDGHKAPRPGDYYKAAPTVEDWLAETPTDGMGLWTGADEIGGENHASLGLWIGDKVIFATYQGTGRIGYDAGTITSTAKVNRLYTYNAADLYAVRDGRKQPWEPVPTITDWPIPDGLMPTARIAGAVADGDDVWIVWVNAVDGRLERYPVLTRWAMR